MYLLNESKKSLLLARQNQPLLLLTFSCLFTYPLFLSFFISIFFCYASY